MMCLKSNSRTCRAASVKCETYMKRHREVVLLVLLVLVELVEVDLLLIYFRLCVSGVLQPSQLAAQVSHREQLQDSKCCRVQRGTVLCCEEAC